MKHVQAIHDKKQKNIFQFFAFKVQNDQQIDHDNNVNNNNTRYIASNDIKETVPQIEVVPQLPSTDNITNDTEINTTAITAQNSDTPPSQPEPPQKEINTTAITAQNSDTPPSQPEPPQKDSNIPNNSTTPDTINIHSPPHSRILPQNITRESSGVNDYELERLERIKRNHEVMKSLGLGIPGQAASFLHKETIKRPSSLARQRTKRTLSSVQAAGPPVEAPPLRRSSRHSKPAAGAMDVDMDIKHQKGEEEDDGGGGFDSNKENKATRHMNQELLSSYDYDDSSVKRYICSTLHGFSHHKHHTNTTIGESDHTTKCSVITDSSCITKYAPSSTVYYDQTLAKAYSLDCQGSLIAAGGKDGRVAVWGRSPASLSVLWVEETSCDEREYHDPQTKEILPLLSQKLHAGWISDVQLLCTYRCNAENTASSAFDDRNSMPLLFTSSNDGSLCVWDITKSTFFHEKKGELPQRILHATDIHSSGIFSMHIASSPPAPSSSSSHTTDHACHILTASKDGSVALSTLLNDGSFRTVHRFEDVHQGGVVKCARWSPLLQNGSSVFASCGNDGVVRIFDVRCHHHTPSRDTPSNGHGSSDTLIAPQAPLELSGDHATAVNCVRWSPLHQHTLLSTSHDPFIGVHDTRMPSRCVYTLTGHCPGSQRIKNMYQPEFVWGGEAIVVAGEGKGSLLSLYRTSDGSTISRGSVDGMTLGAMHCGSGGGGVLPRKDDVLLCTANRSVVVFEPVWEERVAS